MRVVQEAREDDPTDRRDYYVRLDSNDFSVEPPVAGRLVEVTATLDRPGPGS